MNTKQTKTLWRTFTLVCIGLLVGCSAGGTMGTGLGGAPTSWGGSSVTGSMTRPMNSAVTYMQVNGFVYDADGKAVSGARVKISSPRTSENATTDAGGYYSAQVVFGRTEGITFSVDSTAGSGSYMLKNPPHGQTTSSIDITIMKQGGIRLKRQR